MKKTLIAIACGLVLLAGTTQANATALTVGDIYYIGQIVDGNPPGNNEDDYINALILLAAGAGPTPCLTETCDRLGSTAAGPFPAAVEAGKVGSVGEDPSNLGIDATGFTYILGKYDADKAGSYVWLVTGLTDVDLPEKLGSCGNKSNPAGCGLSHWTLFNATAVPDGGATLGLLGFGMLGLGYLKRRLA
jgi:hypothetical protein